MFSMLAAAAFTAAAQEDAAPAGRISCMRCEHLDSPLGIDSAEPRLSWRLPDGISKQTGYYVVVGTDSAAVASGEGEYWNSGIVQSDDILVRYGGKSLEPFTRYFWKVTAWDENQNTMESAVAHFETGMMDAGNWQGCWISDSHDREYKPAPYFRKGFSLGKKVESARAYIAVGGLYELYINGERIGDHRLDPMYTRYDRRNLYVTYDITSSLKEGDNAVGVLLGNGWYNHQSGAVWDFDNAPWRNRPAFCLDIRIRYTDGTSEVHIYIGAL